MHNKTTNTNETPSVRLTFGDVLIEENSNLIRGEIFDGVELKAELVTITVLVTISKTYTVNISPVSYLNPLQCYNAEYLLYSLQRCHSFIRR